MGKKKIFVFGENDTQEAFDKVTDLSKFLRKQQFPLKEKTKAITFVNKEFRSLKRGKRGIEAKIKPLTGDVGGGYTKENEI